MRTFGRYQDVNGTTYFQRVCLETGRIQSEMPVDIAETITMRTLPSIGALPSSIRITSSCPLQTSIIKVGTHNTQLITNDKLSPREAA